MTLREQIEAVRVRLGADSVVEFSNSVAFYRSGDLLGTHCYLIGAVFEGLPKWPPREARAREVLVLFGAELGVLSRASEHSYYLRVGSHEVEVWPEIRRVDVPMSVHLNHGSFGALSTLSKLGYVGAGYNYVSACMFRRKDIGNAEAERLDAAEQLAMREGWHPLCMAGKVDATTVLVDPRTGNPVKPVVGRSVAIKGFDEERDNGWTCEVDVTTTLRSTGPCPDCKGTGVYVGLFETEPCRTCQ